MSKKINNGVIKLFTLYEMKQELNSGKTIFDLPLNVAYYARVSTEKEEQINSLENQVSFFEEYIRKNINWSLVRGYIDEGITGTSSLKRENFMNMIDDAKQKKFDLIITKEVSRFSRDTIDSLFYTRKLLEYDVCVYFLSDNIITASNDGELRLTIMSSMAQDEVRKISERTKFGFKRAIEKGTVLGTNNIWGYRKEMGKLVIDETEAPLIQKIFDIYANNTKIGLKKLSIELVKCGYLNRNGNAIHQNTLKKIIQNPKYKGYYTGKLSTVVDYRTKKRKFYSQDNWKIYKDYEKVPPIVSEDLWEKANQKLLSRSKSSNMYRKHQTLYPLSGKLYCEKHKCNYVRKIRRYKNKPSMIYWYCGHFHKTGKKDCISAYFKEEEIYNILIDFFKKYYIYKNEICNELLNIYIEFSKSKENCDNKKNLQKQLHILKNKKDKLLDLALDGIFTKNDLTSKYKSIENQILTINEELRKIQKSHNKNEKQYFHKIQENIFNELEISYNNLEYYIEGLLDKIIVKEKAYNNAENKSRIEFNIILS